MFLDLLEKKFETTDGKYNDVDVKLKLSQTCPKCGFQEKKSIGERIHICNKCGYKMQRDLTSALLTIAEENNIININKANLILKERGPLLRAACVEAHAKVCEDKSLTSRFGLASELEPLTRNNGELTGDAPSAFSEKIGKPV
jgi:ribosomal protein L37AE/L43A